MWRPTRGASSGQVSLRRGSRRATFPGMERDRRTSERVDERNQVDLATIGLAIFFVSLIVIVALLLVLPAIF